MNAQRFLAVVTLGLGLIAAGGVASAQAQYAPIVSTNTTGNCVTYGTPGNWTISCGDINYAPGQAVVVAPTIDTSSAAGTSGVAPAPVAAPAPVLDTSGEAAPIENAVASESDRDADNYTDALEAEIGLDPSNADTDADGVADGDELNLYQTVPTLADTDGDGAIDGEELFGIKTDPLVWDDFNAASGVPVVIDDGAMTATETTSATALDASALLDSDSDGVADVDELNIYSTEPTLSDTDGDGLSDGNELFASSTDPLVWDTDGDGLGDGEDVSAPSTAPSAPAGVA